MSKMIRRVFSGEIRAIDLERKTIEVVMSDESIDRYEEVILMSAYKKAIKQFARHAVLLSSHRYGDLRNQIGQWEKLWIEDKKLIGRAKYYVGEGNPEADWGFKLAEKGIAAYSVGFIPLKVKDTPYDEWKEAKEKGKTIPRRYYEELDLLETSQVLIPANANALQNEFKDDVVRGLAKRATSELTEDDFSRSEDMPDDKFLVKTVYDETVEDDEIDNLDYATTLGDDVTLLTANEEIVKTDIDNTDVDCKTVIPYHKYPLADEGASWDGPGEVAKAEVNDLKKMCTVIVGDSNVKGSYKLPHHTKTGYKTVWRGVANAAARLAQTDMPSGDVTGVKTHLGKHYEDFGKKSPWSKSVELWSVWEAHCKESTTVDDIARFDKQTFKELFEIELDEYVKDYLHCLDMEHVVEHESHMITCSKCNTEFDYNSISEAGMGYVKCPNCGISIDQEGNVYEEKSDTEIENRGWEETENEIRCRLKDPDKYDKFRRYTIKKDKPRVYGIYGKIKGEDKWETQALRFPKGDGWTMDSAKAWLKEHPIKTFEEAKMEFDEMIAEMLQTLKGIQETLTEIKTVNEAHFKEIGDRLVGIEGATNVNNVLPNKTYVDGILQPDEEEVVTVTDTADSTKLNDIMNLLVEVKTTLEKA